MSQPIPARRAAVPALLVAMLLVAAVAAGPVAAKMFGEARLDGQIPFDSPPGAILVVGATVSVLGMDGRMQAGADGPVFLELTGRYGDVTRELGVADDPPGHYTFHIQVPPGGPRQAEIGLVDEEFVGITWLSSPLTPFPMGPGTAQLAPAGTVTGSGAVAASVPAAVDPAAPAPVAPAPAAVDPAAGAPGGAAPAPTPSMGLLPAAAALVAGLAAVVLALVAFLLLRRSRGAPSGRAADGAPGA